MGVLVRQKDWAATAIGPPQSWTDSQKVAASICLNSQFPIVVWFGPELIMIYNDAYIPFLGEAQHPAMLGAPGQVAWREIWSIVGPIHEQAFRGQASSVDDVQFFFARRLPREETYVTFSYSPIFSATGREVEGVFCACVETTKRVIGERRLSLLKDLTALASQHRTVDAACTAAAVVLDRYPFDTPFAAVYLLEDGGRWAQRLAATAGAADPGLLPGRLDVGEPESGWPLADAISSPAGALVNHLPGRIGAFSTPWEEPVETALMKSLHGPGRTAPRGVLIVGLSPRCVIDKGYRDFVDLVAVAIATAIAEAEAFEEAHGRAEALAELRRTSAEELRRSEAKLKAACDLLGLSPYSWDPRTNRLEWDARLKAMWGLPPEAEIDYETWLAAIHPDDRAAVLAEVNRCVQPDGDGVYAIEYRVIGVTDGVERWVSTFGRASFEEGQAVELVGAAVEVTQRKRAERALRDSDRRFRLFAENTSNVLWMIDPDSCEVVYCNRAMEQVWGPGSGASWTDLDGLLATLHPEDREAAQVTLQSVRETGRTATLEYRILRPDGSVRWIHDLAFPIRDERGKVAMIGGIARDVSGEDGSVVYLVDGDDAAREAHGQALRDAGFSVKVFASARGFLDVADVLLPGCVVLDMREAPGAGIAVCQELQARRLPLPVVVLDESDGNVPRAVRVMKAGAVDFLHAPCRAQTLVAAVASAMAEVNSMLRSDQASEEARQRMRELSQREREVLDLLIAGGTNKTIGRELGISPRTVESHRAHVMERLGASTLSEMVRIAAEAGLRPPRTKPA